MNENLSKIFDLISKTDNKCIIWDSRNDRVFVMMSLNSYQELVSEFSDFGHLTKDEIVNKINRDIADWEVSQKEEEIKETLKLSNDETAEKEDASSASASSEDKYYFEPIDQGQE